MDYATEKLPDLAPSVGILLKNAAIPAPAGRCPPHVRIRLVNAVLKSLLLVLLLLALPLQGMAAAARLHCSTPAHCAQAADHGQQHASHSTADAGCCSAPAAIAPALALPAALPRMLTEAIPFTPGHVPNVTRAPPERPPQA